MADAGIIRNRLKVNAAIHCAQAIRGFPLFGTAASPTGSMRTA